jgi:Transcriptional regulator
MAGIAAKTKGEQNKRERSAGTRARVLAAAVDAFGRLGYDGASIRAIAVAAGANIQAIMYHFGGKEALYLEVASHLGGEVGGRMRETRERITGFLTACDEKGKSPPPADAASLLAEAAKRLADTLLNPDMEARARFIIREQMECTPGFERLYEQAVQPFFAMCSRLVAVLLGEDDPNCLRVRLRTLSFLGGIMVFRFGHATLLKQLEKEKVGKREMAEIYRNIDEAVASLRCRKSKS